MCDSPQKNWVIVKAQENVKEASGNLEMMDVIKNSLKMLMFATSECLNKLSFFFQINSEIFLQ